MCVSSCEPWLRPPVPIIPTFLYAIDHPSPKAQLAPPTPTPWDGPPGGSTQETSDPETLVHNASSRGDAWTRTRPTTEPLNRTDSAVGGRQRSARGRGQVSDSAPSGQNSSCLQDAAFLEQENLRVGFLFASKALVQLLVNPGVGPLTNRYTHTHTPDTHTLRCGAHL